MDDSTLKSKSQTFYSNEKSGKVKDMLAIPSIALKDQERGILPEDL